jgi:UDP-N-acetyl-2-amino-2-deoxyglucuronate dehydrogenase
MLKTIRVGLIIEPESAHKDAYLTALAQTEEAGSVAVADPTGKSFEQAKKLLGPKLDAGTFKDSKEMLAKTMPQLALVTLPAVDSPATIAAALEAGCHVLSEKPACVRAEDFEPLVKKAQQKHRHLMLALANRLHAPIQEARKLVRNGALGKLYGAEVHLIADQTRLKNPEYRKLWFASKARGGGGHLLWLGIHWLDLMQYITGKSVQQVAGFIANVGGQPLDVEDSAVLALRFEGGLHGTMHSGYYLDKGYHSHLVLWGEHGWLRCAPVEEQPLEWYSAKGNDKPQMQRFEYPKGERGYTPFVRAAVRAAAGMEPPPITGEECLLVLKAVFAAYRAAESGKVQTVS